MFSAGTHRRTAWIVSSLTVFVVLSGCRDTVRPRFDPDAGDVEWDLFYGDYYRAPGELVIEPAPVVFDVEEIGVAAFEEVTFRNEGIGELVIFQLDSEGTDWDLVEILDADLPIGLSPNEEIQVTLAYTPDSCDEMEAQLKVAWSNEGAPRMEVGLLSVGLSAQIEVAPEYIAFGRVGAHALESREVTISNLGRCPLSIDRLYIEGSQSFYLSAGEPGRETVPIAPELPLEVSFDEPFRFAVTFDSPEDVPEDATLVIGDQTTGETIEIPISGNRRECPVAVAAATLAEEPGAPQNELHAIPLQTVLFDATGSYDPDREVVGYKWTILERPDDSTAALVPNGNVPSPSFFLDLAGDYIFELTVYDDDGLASCNTDLVTVSVVPNEDIHVQLVWHTPGDPNELDYDGTDLDLHLLRESARWDESNWDCNWHNMNPDWGESGNADDDPSLDIDDVDGAGPENINLDQPERDTAYTIGVYYYSDRNMGTSYATVRVFIDGILVYEVLDKALQRTANFWEVGRINWPSNSVEVIDRMHPFGFP